MKTRHHAYIYIAMNDLEITNSTYVKVKVKVKQSHYRPKGFQEVKVPRFRDKGTGWW